MKLLDGLEVVSKRCRGPCGKHLPIESFNLKKDARDGRQSYCIECSRTTTKKSMRRLRGLEGRARDKDRARFDDWAARWLQAHPEKEGNP